MESERFKKLIQRGVDLSAQRAKQFIADNNLTQQRIAADLGKVARDEESADLSRWSRRDLLRAGAIGLASLGIRSTIDRFPDRHERPDESEYERLSPAPIEHFQNLRSGVLVLTANQDEKYGVLDTLRQRNNNRSLETQYQFQETGAITKAIAPTSAFDVPVIIVNQDDLSRRVVRRRLSDEAFHLVQLRGHTVDMPDLHAAAEPMMDRHCLVMLGGCRGEQFLNTWYSPERPMLVDSEEGEAAVNTYLLMRMIDELPQAENWQSLYSNIASNARLDRMDILMPGDPQYLSRLI